MTVNYTGDCHPDMKRSGSALLKVTYFHINCFSNMDVFLDIIVYHIILRTRLCSQPQFCHHLLS